LKTEILAATAWVAFEPNTELTWEQVRRDVAADLQERWQVGDLVGRTAVEAYFVRCDRTTMNQADLDGGLLVCEVGVALIRPAEFVIFRIGQRTADARC
jgi:phage tail sheath protein FI